MSEDSILSTTELANGVKLIWPSRLDVKELSYSIQMLGLNIDHLYRASTNPDYQRLIDGTILKLFNENGLNQAT